MDAVMLRKMTKYEKSCNPLHDYVFERNGYVTFLTAENFKQLAEEVNKLTMREPACPECGAKANVMLCCTDRECVWYVP